MLCSRVITWARGKPVPTSLFSLNQTVGLPSQPAVAVSLVLEVAEATPSTPFGRVWWPMRAYH